VTAGIDARYLSLLRASGADKLVHSGRTLLDHLVGTYRLLKGWGDPEPVCTGGLFHSIYGTNVFRPQAIKPWERDRVRAVIGTEAEEFAHLFCSLNRPLALLDAIDSGTLFDRLQGGAIAVERSALQALLEIECANLIEQGSRTVHLRLVFCKALMTPSLISKSAYSAVKDYLGRPALQDAPAARQAQPARSGNGA
jgi:hypothetical protein